MGRPKGRGDEHSCRVNYLFQAGKMLAKQNPELSQYYGQVLTVITEKTVPKKDFTMKRSMCKRCRSILTVGENAAYRLRKNKHRKGCPNIVITCQVCEEAKRIPTKKGYRLHAEVKGVVTEEKIHRVLLAHENENSKTSSNNNSTSTATNQPVSDDPNVNDASNSSPMAIDNSNVIESQ